MDKDKTKEQLMDELVETRQRVAELKAADTERKRAEQAIPERRIWLSAAGMFVLLCILVWLNELVDLPHLLLGAPRTPINWREAVVEMILIASVGLFVLSRLSRDITERQRAEEEIKRRNRELAALNAIATMMMQSVLDLAEVLQQIADGVVEGLGCNTAVILLLDEKGGVFKGSAVSTRGKILERINAIIGFSLSQIEFPARRDFNETVSNALDGRITIKHDLYELVGPALSKPVCSILQGLLGSRTFLGLPLLARGKVVGGIFASTTRVELSEVDTETMMTFANQAATAIRNARLYEEARSRAERLAVVNRIARAASATLHLDDLMETAYREVSSIFRADAFFIALYNREANELDFCLRVDEGVREPRERRPLGTELTSLVVSEKKPILIRDFEKEKDHLPEVRLWGTMKAPPSWLGVPMLIGDRVVGVISVQAYQPHAYGEEEELLLSTIADQVAVAIENARLYEAERRRSAELEALRQASLHLISSLDLQPILEAILDHAFKLVAADDVHVFLYDGKRLVFGAALWEDGHQQEPYAEPRPQGLTYTVARSGERIVVPDMNSHPLFRDYQWGGSIVGLPLRIGERVVGVMTIAFEKPHAFDESELRVLGLLADQAAIAIENARLYKETQQRALEQETLREAALALTTALDRNQVIERILAQLQQVVPYDSASVQLFRDNRMEIVGGRGFPNLPDLLGVSFPVDGDNPNSEVIRGRAPFIVEDAPTVYEGFRKGPHMQTVIRSWLGVPMLIGEQLVGMIALDKSEPGFYTQEHARLAEAFAAQAAIAIENARLFEETERLKAFNESIVQGMSEGIAVEDIEGYLTYVNPALTAMLGYSRKELLGHHWTIIVPPDQQAIVQAASERRKRGEADRYELQLMHRDGTRVPVLVSGSPWFEEGRFAGTLAVLTDITARKRMEEALRALALVDDLTGLYNRRGFFTLSRQQLKMADRTKIRMVLLFADFDDLKHINDTLGHREGDQALIEVANALRKKFRESDIIARLGGDEFVVLAIETGGAGTDAITTRLQRDLEVLNARKSCRYKLSLTIGTAYYDPEYPCSIDELLARADRAMYERKRDDTPE